MGSASSPLPLPASPSSAMAVSHGSRRRKSEPSRSAPATDVLWWYRLVGWLAEGVLTWVKQMHGCHTLSVAHRQKRVTGEERRSAAPPQHAPVDEEGVRDEARDGVVGHGPQPVLLRRVVQHLHALERVRRKDPRPVGLWCVCEKEIRVGGWVGGEERETKQEQKQHPVSSPLLHQGQTNQASC